ncbi:hypothetical protein [Enterovirga sp. CN4-39]|uniref:hypothetical protein n=1 Tax=Enterovirga sp. CN4-39 TaxID=3400910 RepID=UPI003C0C76F4
MTSILERAKSALGAEKKGEPTSTGQGGKSDLQKNAEKALRMKQEAGPQTSIPEHQTAREGGVQGGQVGYSDTGVGQESTYTSNLKRSHNPRSGDA